MGATECPECGFGYVSDIESNVEAHNAFHDEFLNGPITPRPNGTYFISPESTHELRQLAGDAARLGHWDTPYDFPLYSGDDAESSPIVALEIRDGRAAGIIVTRDQNCKGRVWLRDFEPHLPQMWGPTKVEHVSPHPRRTITFIWVLKKYRRHGIIDELLHNLETHLGQPLVELAHGLPFSESAVKFWQRQGIAEFYV